MLGEYVAVGQTDDQGVLQMGRFSKSVVLAALWAVSANNDVANGQQFVEVASLSGGDHASVAWGDYDNDGDLDLLVSAGYQTQILTNRGGNVFGGGSHGLVGLTAGSAKWGDFNNDGLLDIGIVGLATGPSGVSKIYQNMGQGVFADTVVSLTQVIGSTFSWGDFDNDGRLDALLNGQVLQSGNVTKIYRNNGGTEFLEATTNFVGCESGAQSSYMNAVGDYDNDGDNDFLVAGSIVPTGFATKLYRNDGNGQFSDIVSNLPAVRDGSVRWGDYDADGDLDVLIVGQFTSAVYRNAGNGFFANGGGTFLSLAYGCAMWGDFNNDGYLDIVMAGYTGGTSRAMKFYAGSATRTFTESDGLVPLQNCSLAWGDYDGDGDLDLAVAGETTPSGTYVTKIFRNNVSVRNSPPSPPTGLRASRLGNKVVFSWNRSTDSTTAQASLTYALRVGTAPGRSDVMSASADPMTGRRRIAAMGECNLDTTWTIGPLAPGTYYWSVQAIDNCFAGSPFASEQTVIVSGLQDEAHEGIVCGFNVYQNYPNPFNPSTSIRYALPERSNVTLTVYNTLGQEVATLVQGEKEAGHHEAVLDASGLSSGVYFYRLTAGAFTETKRMLLLR
jgi:hypothetical protein